MSIVRSVGVFVTSLLAIPLTYLVNTAQTLHGDFGLLVSGISALFLVCFLTYFIVSRTNDHVEPLFYVFTIGMFSSAVDIIIGLENDGLLKGFMSSYLLDGEPYLKTAHGTMICYWDGTGHYLMYISMLIAMAYRKSYREIGLYWAGSIGNSMLVFIPGNLLGEHQIHWSFLLNIPYIIIPFVCGARFLSERNSVEVKSQIKVPSQKSAAQRILEMMFIAWFLLALAVAFFRGFAVLGSNSTVLNDYVQSHDPYLADPATYPKMQMLVYLFYFVPFYIMAVYELSTNQLPTWIVDWSLIHAGAAAQAQISHIGSSLRLYPKFYGIPPGNDMQLIIRLMNLSLLVVPQIFAIYCYKKTSQKELKKLV